MKHKNRKTDTKEMLLKNENKNSQKKKNYYKNREFQI